MGERGHTIHVLGGEGAARLERVGHAVAVLGSGERWTSFVPTQPATFDTEEAAVLLERPLLHLWYDDDFGVSARVYASGELVGELSLPGDGSDPSEADFELTGALEQLGVLDRVQRAALLTRMSDPEGLREWTLGHGFEKLLGLPYYQPMPSELPERELLALLPSSARVVGGASARASMATRRLGPPRRATSLAGGSSLPPSRAWTAEDEAVVALHCEYWLTVFAMNTWALAERYRRYLPAKSRPEVDRLLEAVAQGDEAAVPRIVLRILSRIWGAEDWLAVLRDPALADGDEADWRAWIARLDRELEG